MGIQFVEALESRSSGGRERLSHSCDAMVSRDISASSDFGSASSTAWTSFVRGSAKWNGAVRGRPTRSSSGGANGRIGSRAGSGSGSSSVSVRLRLRL